MASADAKRVVILYKPLKVSGTTSYTKVVRFSCYKSVHGFRNNIYVLTYKLINKIQNK